MSSDYLGDYRIFISLFLTLLLVIIFLIDHGFEYAKYPRLPIGIIRFVIFLLITLICSTVFSFYINLSFIATIRVMTFLVICYLIYSLIKEKIEINILIYSLIVVTILSGISMFIDLYQLGLQKFFIRGVLEDKYTLIAPKGFTGETIFFISFTLLIALLFKNERKSFYSKLVIWLLILVNGILLILANSRGGILAAVIATAVFLLIIKPKIFFKLFLIIVSLLIVLFVLSSNFKDTFEAYMRLETVDQRLVYWNMGLEIIRDNPVFGVGPDTFHKQFFNYIPSSFIRFLNPELSNLGSPHPHNFFIYFFAENGILGLLTAILFFIMFFYYAVKTFNKSRKLNSEFYIFTAVILSIGIGIFIRSFLEITGYLTYGYIKTDLPFWLLFITLLKINVQLSDETISEMRR